MTENKLAVVREMQPLTMEEVKTQVNRIQEIMRSVMQEGTHYGKVPGCGDKPTLLKAGAEKLCLTFNLTSKFAVTERDMGNGHRQYEVRCSLYLRGTDVLIAEGVGNCSTMESKYRYRWDSTGHDVPQEYWETRDQELLGGPSYCARKVKDRWMVYRKVEHDNPADYYNTAEKMAKKRAHVDAAITATSASDIFTQDIEEMPEVAQEPVVIIEAEGKVKEAPQTAPKPQPKPAAPKPPPSAPKVKADGSEAPWTQVLIKLIGKKGAPEGERKDGTKWIRRTYVLVDTHTDEEIGWHTCWFGPKEDEVDEAWIPMMESFRNQKQAFWVQVENRNGTQTIKAISAEAPNAS